MSIEAMKQALDALEKNYKLINGDETRFGLEGALDGYYSGCFDVAGTNKETESAITSLRQAIKELESQESNPIKEGWKLSVANGHSGYGVYAHMEEYPEEGAFLLLSIKEVESQEPVAWMKPDVLCDRACMYLCTKGFTQFPECATTHPPQRKPLTDDEVSLVAHNEDPEDWNSLEFRECWHEGFVVGFRAAEECHKIGV